MKIVTKIDVLIPTRNEEKYIEQCLRSINYVFGTYIKARIILVNDMSTDQTVLIAKKTIESLPKLELIIINIKKHDPKKYRLAEVLNHGLTYINSLIFLRLDADMVITKNMLKLYKKIVHNEKIGAIGGHMPCLPNKVVNNAFNIILGKFLTSNGFFRTFLVKQLGYHTVAEDTFLYGKIQEMGFKTEYANEFVGIQLREHTRIDFKKRWEHYTIASVNLGFPRWYPFVRLGRAILRSFTHLNLQTFILCLSMIGVIILVLRNIDLITLDIPKDRPYFQNGTFNLRKYLQQRK